MIVVDLLPPDSWSPALPDAERQLAALEQRVGHALPADLRELHRRCAEVSLAEERFEHRVMKLDAVNLDEAMTTRTLAILHVQSDSLDGGAWRVLGRRAITIDPFSGPDGKWGEVGGVSWEGLEHRSG